MISPLSLSQTKYPEKLLIAEDLKADAKVTMEHGYDGLNFDAQWDSEFVHPVKEVLVKTDDAFRNLQEIVNALTFRYNDDAFERVVYTESHDEVANGKSRIPEEIQPGGRTAPLPRSVRFWLPYLCVPLRAYR